MAKEGMGVSESLGATVIKKPAVTKCSLRMILIEEDNGTGQNVRPLAQAEILKIELADAAAAKDALLNYAKLAQAAIKDAETK